MKVTITVEMDSAAFEDTPEVELSRILYALAKQVGYPEVILRMGAWPIRDINGNKVGVLEFTE